MKYKLLLAAVLTIGSLQSASACVGGDRITLVDKETQWDIGTINIRTGEISKRSGDGIAAEINRVLILSDEQEVSMENLLSDTVQLSEGCDQYAKTEEGNTSDICATVKQMKNADLIIKYSFQTEGGLVTRQKLVKGVTIDPKQPIAKGMRCGPTK